MTSADRAKAEADVARFLEAAAYGTNLQTALEDLRIAVDNPGPKPRHHYAILTRHRREWPTLWAAIDHLLELEARKETRP